MLCWQLPVLTESKLISITGYWSAHCELVTFSSVQVVIKLLKTAFAHRDVFHFTNYPVRLRFWKCKFTTKWITRLTYILSTALSIYYKYSKYFDLKISIRIPTQQLNIQIFRSSLRAFPHQRLNFHPCLGALKAAGGRKQLLSHPLCHREWKHTLQTNIDVNDPKCFS